MLDGARAGAATAAVDAASGDIAGDVAAEVLDGLTRRQKTLPAKLFYDEEGCRLFGLITELPEYYLTRTERALLAAAAPEIARFAPADAALVEYGASDEAKAVQLLDAAPGGFAAYVPIDIAAPALRQLAQRMADSHPTIAVHPVVADFLHPLDLPAAIGPLRRFGFFPGSTIGNLDPAMAGRFLRTVRRALGRGAYFLVGADVRKDPALLIPAYDDAAGVTAAFNRNILVRLNREFGADFDPDQFAHCAVWNEAESRIEMHLVSRVAQSVHLLGATIRLASGETIHTENSYKHTVAGLTGIAERAGWRSAAVWTDADALFSLHLFEAGDAPTRAGD